MNAINRRSFLGASLALGATFAAREPSCRAASDSQAGSANDEIRVAVIGMGGFGGVGGRGRQLIDRLKPLSGIRMTALCDVDESLLNHEYKKLGSPPEIKRFRDMRQVFDDDEIDAVFIALPNHWHALSTIWACQAGKDVYVEKPASYNLWEGRQMVNAARKYKRIVQTGTQARSSDIESQLADYVRGGQLGKATLARAIVYRRRESIGKVDRPQPIPESVDYDLWLGPAPQAKLMRRELHYLWHWDWVTGNGEIGNNGVHYLDRCRWILGHDELPPRAISFGNRFLFDDDGNTPNTQVALLDYESAPILCEVRGLTEKAGSKSMDKFRGIDMGIVIECEGGHITFDRKSAIAYDRSGKKITQFEDRREAGTSASAHQANFFAVMRSRNPEQLNAEILDGHRSAALCHIANISYRLGGAARPGEIIDSIQKQPELLNAFQRMSSHLQRHGIELEKTSALLGPWLNLDPSTETFTGPLADAANRLCRRAYRKPFEVPEV